MTLKKSLHFLAIAALFLIPIFPLIIANSFFFPFITGKAFYFRILVEIAFASWVILAFLDARYRPRISGLTIGVTLFAVIALLADLLGVNPLRSIWSNFERMEGWLTVLHLWAFYLVSTSMFGVGEEGKRSWHRWLNVSLFVAGITILYAFAQLFGWAAIHQGSSRLDASLGNSAYFAVYLLIHVGIATYMFFVAQARAIVNAGFLRWVYPILGVIFSFIIFQTQTRGTILGLIGGILLALALFAIFGARAQKKSRLISTGVIALIIVIGVVFWFNRDASFIKNNAVLSRIASISWNETKTQARAYIWPMALKGSLERPILGWGQENFNYIFNANYNPKMWSQEQWFDRAHSVYLDWLVASGFVGLIAYLALYVLLLVAVWKSDISVAQKSILTGLTVGYAIHNVFVFDNLASYVFFFALLGFVGSISTSAKGHHSKLHQRIQRATFSKDAVEYIVAPIAVVVLVAGLYFFSVRPIQANTRLITALHACGDPTTVRTDLFEHALALHSYTANQEIREQILSCAASVINSSVSSATKQAFFNLAAAQIDAQVAATPNDARMYILGGSFVNNYGEADKAVALLEKAHALSPAKQSISLQLATAYANNERADEAVALLKQTYESDSTFPAARSAYITGLIIVGKESEARTLFGSDPTLFETEQVARAYVVVKQYTKAIAIYKKLLVADPTNINLKVQLAQAQYDGGMQWAATETLKSIAVDRPDLKPQVDAAIKQMQAPK